MLIFPRGSWLENGVLSDLPGHFFTSDWCRKLITLNEQPWKCSAERDGTKRKEPHPTYLQKGCCVKAGVTRKQCQDTALAPSARTHRSCGSFQKHKLCVAVDHGNDWQCSCRVSCQNISPGGAKSSDVVFFILFNIDASCTVSCNIVHIWFSHSQKTFLSLLLDCPKARSKPPLLVKILLLPLALVWVRV